MSYINTQTLAYPVSPAAIREAHPNTSFPADLSLIDLTGFGFAAVQPTAPPAVDPITHTLQEIAPEQSGGQWCQRWQLSAYTTPEMAARRWVKIQELRDALIEDGGCLVGAKWFHSDTKSKVQQIALVMVGANLPGGILWKTTDGSFIEMTPTLAQQVFAAQMAREQTIFAFAESLRENLAADINQGWPARYSS